MGDFIPHEELEKFLATCNDASARKYSRDAADKAKIQADNVGHKLLSKMGWKEGSPFLSSFCSHTTGHTAHTNRTYTTGLKQCLAGVTQLLKL